MEKTKTPTVCWRCGAEHGGLYLEELPIDAVCVCGACGAKTRAHPIEAMELRLSGEWLSDGYRRRFPESDEGAGHSSE